MLGKNIGLTKNPISLQSIMNNENIKAAV